MSPKSAMAYAHVRTLHVWCLNDTEYVIAIDQQDAHSEWLSRNGGDHVIAGKAFDWPDWVKCPDSWKLTVDDGDYESAITKTCREWADTHGLGFLWSDP